VERYTAESHFQTLFRIIKAGCNGNKIPNGSQERDDPDGLHTLEKEEYAQCGEDTVHQFLVDL